MPGAEAGLVPRVLGVGGEHRLPGVGRGSRGRLEGAEGGPGALPRPG